MLFWKTQAGGCKGQSVLVSSYTQKLIINSTLAQCLWIYFWAVNIELLCPWSGQQCLWSQTSINGAGVNKIVLARPTLQGML